MSIKVLNGSRTSFWNDNWLGNGALKDLFSDIYARAHHQQRFIAEMWSPQGWELILIRDLNDWKINRMIEFYKQLDNFTGIQNGDDTLRWQGHSSGKFSVSAAYKTINQQYLKSPTGLGNIFGRPRYHIRLHASHSYWQKEVVLTHENLNKRKMFSL